MSDQVKRPQHLSSEVWAKAEPVVREKIPQISCLEECDVDEVVEAMKKAHDMDGYKLAKHLEDELFLDDLYASDVDDLDEFDGIFRTAQDEAVKDWVKTNNIVSPFKVGDKATFKHSWKQMTGIVDRIDAEKALLFMKVEGEKGFPIIRFEDAKPA